METLGSPYPRNQRGSVWQTYEPTGYNNRYFKYYEHVVSIASLWTLKHWPLTSVPTSKNFLKYILESKDDLTCSLTHSLS